jgi:hypothetical protein
MKFPIKVAAFLFFFCVNCFLLKAQQKHFIYVQSDDKQPFAVVLGGKVYSSSDYGYVIIPKLVDSTYDFTVSFPMNKFPDQAFTCTINKKDAGYILKNETDGWALENMQTQKIIMNGNAALAKKNAFGNMLSDVVSDSTLTKNNIPQKAMDTIKTDTIASMALTDTVAANNGSVADSLQQPEKISELKQDTGTNMLFVDKTQNGSDTINVFVPAEPANHDVTADQKTVTDNTTTNPSSIAPLAVIVPNSQKNATADSADNTSTGAEVQDTAAHGVSNPFYKPEQNNNTTADSGSNAAAQTAAVGASNTVKEDCAKMISDDDFEKLKRKMFVQKNVDEMIQYAIKFMNKKCITTDQVKLLGGLFSSDDGRYSLYDAMYKYVYDYGNYPTLASQILDPYYKKRFAAMLR